MTTWTDALIKEIEQKQEQAIASTYELLKVYGLTIDTVRTIVKSKSPNQSDDGGVIFISRCHENLWTEMVDEPLELMTEDFVEQVQDRLILQDWLNE